MTFQRQRLSFVLAVAAAAAGLSAAPAMAQGAYPSKPVLLIVPTAAGGTTDLSGRMAAQALAEDDTAMGRPMVLMLAFGLVLGLGTAGIDSMTGNAIRAGVRGLHEVPATLAFGLKPAGSVMALLLPLLPPRKRQRPHQQRRPLPLRRQPRQGPKAFPRAQRTPRKSSASIPRRRRPPARTVE